MTGNHSLDEFADGPADDPDVAEPPPEGAEPEAAASATSDDDPPVEPMAETLAWSTDGAACDSCGSTVEHRWRDGDDLVCEDCKAW